MAGNNANKISIIFTLFEMELHYTDLILYNLVLMQIKIWKYDVMFLSIYFVL